MDKTVSKVFRAMVTHLYTANVITLVRYEEEIKQNQCINRGYPAKRALSAMRKHGG